MSDSRANFTVSGVESESEAREVEDELQQLRGVQMGTVDHESGDAEVRYDEELLSEEEIRSAVRDLGYDAE